MILGRLPVNVHAIHSQVHEPDLGHAGASVARQLDPPIEVRGRIPDLDETETMARPRRSVVSRSAIRVTEIRQP